MLLANAAATRMTERQGFQRVAM